MKKSKIKKPDIRSITEKKGKHTSTQATGPKRQAVETSQSPTRGSEADPAR